MVALGVVVLHELAHDGSQVTLTEGDDMPQALVLDRPNERNVSPYPVLTRARIRGWRVPYSSTFAEPAVSLGDSRAGYFTDPRELAVSGHASCNPSIIVMEACPGSLPHPPSSCRGVVVVVKSAEHGDRDDRAAERARRAFTGKRNLLADPLMRPSLVEVAQGVFNEGVP
jgi:hypothetical protein